MKYKQKSEDMSFLNLYFMRDTQKSKDMSFLVAFLSFDGFSNNQTI